MTEASLTLVVRASKAPLNDPTRLLHRAAQAGRQASPLPTARLPLSRGFSESIFPFALQDRLAAGLPLRRPLRVCGQRLARGASAGLPGGPLPPPRRLQGGYQKHDPLN